MKEELQELIAELKEVSGKALRDKQTKGSMAYYERLVGAELQYVYKRLELILKENSEN